MNYREACGEYERRRRGLGHGQYSLGLFRSRDGNGWEVGIPLRRHGSPRAVRNVRPLCSGKRLATRASEYRAPAAMGWQDRIRTA